MTTFVLQHPAWFGGWCWKKVVPLLRARGHDIFTPTLTGLGEKFVPEAWGITDETDLGWALARLRPTPFGHFKDAVRRRNPLQT
jgi:hypothetical protein